MICHRRYRVSGIRIYIPRKGRRTEDEEESRASNYECAAEGAATRAREEKRRDGRRKAKGRAKKRDTGLELL